MRGFTLVDLMLVIGVIGLVVGVVVLSGTHFASSGCVTNATENGTIDVTEESEPFQICLDTECIVCTRWHKTDWITSLGGD